MKKKRLKILFISNDSTNYGSSRSMINLAEELLKYDLDIRILIPRKGDIETILKEKKLKYKIFRYYPWVNYIDIPLTRFEKTKRLLLNYLFSIILSFIVKTEKVDIIHSVNSAVYIGALITKITKIKHIWHVRELMEEDHNLEFFNKKYSYKLLNEADRIICISNVVKNKYDKILNKEKIRLVYNGIPVNEYKNNKIRISKDFNILIAGTLAKTKGQLEAIKAIEVLVRKDIKNIKLYIAGSGDYEVELKNYVNDHMLSDYVEFLGFIKNLNQVRENMHIALVCSRNEAFGRITIESMMSKNLVIAANTGGSLELIQDGKTGFFYNQGDYKDLSKKIEYCINNWNKCDIIIKEAYNYSIKNFSIDICAKKVLDVYKEII